MNLTLILFLILVVAVQSSAQGTEKQNPEGDLMEAQASFKILGWDEESFSEVSQGGKLTHVQAVKSYTGDIKGEGRLRYLMRYNEDGSAEFYGLERIIGSIGDRSGSFVLQHTGTFEKGTMNQQSTVLKGSGTEDLTGLQGETTLTAGHQEEYPFTFSYEID